MSLLRFLGLCLVHEYGSWFVWDEEQFEHRPPRPGETGKRMCKHCNHEDYKDF